MNDKTRAFTKRFQAATATTAPNMTNAACYSGALHFLKAVKDIGAQRKGDGAASSSG